ncbi:MAG: TRAM domain-containing protein, partial [Deferrisomatales bacterium]|nr:TRAM domain-containing protein [Deferrisomatales bacterium]
MRAMTSAGFDRVATLRIDAVADQGMALGRLGGKVAFVPFAAPGDLVEVEVVREKARYAETRLVRVLEPSPLRREPPCPRFGVCGGCQWQHLPYPDQLQAKVRSFQGFLAGRAGMGPSARFLPPLSSPREWGYRNRVGLKVRRVEGAVQLGYFARGSHRLVPVDRCPIAHPAIEAFLPPLGRFLGGFPPARTGLPQVDLQIDGLEGLWAVFHVLAHPTAREIRSLRAFLEGEGLAGACLQTGRKHTLSPLLGETLGAMPFRVQADGRDLALGVSPGGFVQANGEVNQALVHVVASLAECYEARPALDLYCGAGNFTLPLALRAASVVGLEAYPPAARDAQANAEANGLRNVRVLPQPAAEGLRRLAGEGFHPSFALLDPPREGAADAIAGLGTLAPDRLLYVSCSPPTLARD